MFQSEARFGQISDTHCCWARRPMRPMVKARLTYQYPCAYGAVSAMNGKFDSLVPPGQHRVYAALHHRNWQALPREKYCHGGRWCELEQKRHLGFTREFAAAFVTNILARAQYTGHAGQVARVVFLQLQVICRSKIKKGTRKCRFMDKTLLQPNQCVHNPLLT